MIKIKHPDFTKNSLRFNIAVAAIVESILLRQNFYYKINVVEMNESRGAK